jgi:hypothetical protein
MESMRRSEVAAFFKDKIAFSDPSTEVSGVTSAVNDLGNFLLTPARYLWNGKTMTAVKANTWTTTWGNSPDPTSSILFKNVHDVREHDGRLKTALKTAASILLLVPGVLLGSIIKGAALLGSRTVSQANSNAAHFDIAEEKYRNTLPYQRKFEALEVALATNDGPEVENILSTLLNDGNLIPFLTRFASADPAKGDKIRLDQFPTHGVGYDAGQRETILAALLYYIAKKPGTTAIYYFLTQLNNKDWTGDSIVSLKPAEDNNMHVEQELQRIANLAVDAINVGRSSSGFIFPKLDNR